MDKYGPLGFTVLGFPCNQFGGQEPGDNDEILNCLKYVRPGNGFVPNFPLFQKIRVNGATQDPMWIWMKSQCGFPPQSEIGAWPYIVWNPVTAYDITWNFEKFLFAKGGLVYKRYGPGTLPLSMEADIVTLLGTATN